MTGVKSVRPGLQGAGLRAVKTVHTLAWFTIESAMVYVLYAGFRGHSDRRAGLAGAIVLAETAVFAGNGFHCPLTAVAKRLGDATGSVTDIYLPKWFARNLPAIHVPLIVLAVAFHWRNLRRLPPLGRRGAATRVSAATVQVVRGEDEVNVTRVTGGSNP